MAQDTCADPAVDEVFPDVPIRQWVLTVPHRLRYLLAWNHGHGFAPNVEGQGGHGLRLLRARLDTLFGDRASLRIDSRPGATSCVIEVPVQ